MKFFKNIKLGQRIQLYVIPLLVILFVFAGLMLNYMSRKRVFDTARLQANVYIDKTIQIIDAIEKKTGKGFTADDKFELKPYFQNPAYNTTDFPCIISRNGEYLIHTFREGQRIPMSALTQLKAKTENQGCIYYRDFVDNSEEERMLCFKYYQPYNAYVAISVSSTEILASLNNYRRVLNLIIVLSSLIIAIVIHYMVKPIVRNINLVNIKLRQLSNGDIPNHLKIESNDEIGVMVGSLNKLIDGLKHTTEFAHEIGQNKLDFKFNPLSNKDELGNALLEMQSNLKRANDEELRRKEEDNIRSWTNIGLAKFGDILRQNNNNLNILADSIIQNLVNYLEANQGGIFVYTEAESDRYLELLSAFAYNRKKYFDKVIQLGEGLVGTCAQEKHTIYLKEIPENYIAITSGLGEATPSSLLIVPLKLEEDIFGVIEIASFREFNPFEVEFVEKIGESIASTLYSVKNNIRTTILLEQSQQQREEMAAQEEEMRQNMEEMQATQEEMSRKNIELEVVTAAINQALLSMTLSEDGYIVDSNTNFQSLVGFSKLELDGKPFLELVHSGQRDDFSTLWEQVLAGQAVNETLHLVGNNGVEFYIMTSISPGMDDMGMIIKIFLVGQDITEAKKLDLKAQRQAVEIEQAIIELKKEQDLSAQREKDMETLLKALDRNCLVTVLEPEGLITYINNKNVETLGDAKEDIEGKFLQDIDYSAKNKPKEFRVFWDNLHNGLKQTRVFSLNVNNKEVWIQENYTPVMDENGSLYRIINIGFDITENKNKEIEMTNLINQLKDLKDKK
ncbi:MAG: PAS domain-containing protein [Bacteroidales bacterium]